MRKADYKTWFFDCDGVILDSNSVKTEAFRDTLVKYGLDNVRVFLDYHQRYGGISRFEKFEYFFKKIMKSESYKEEVASALEEFRFRLKSRLMECDETESLRKFLQLLPPDGRKVVVSGGEETELREVLGKKGLASYFDGIFGSPDNKVEILKREFKESNLPAVFIGDSQYDYECSRKTGLEFVFMYQHTEFGAWESFFKDKKVWIIKNLGEL